MLEMFNRGLSVSAMIPDVFSAPVTVGSLLGLGGVLATGVWAAFEMKHSSGFTEVRQDVRELDLKMTEVRQDVRDVDLKIKEVRQDVREVDLNVTALNVKTDGLSLKIDELILAFQEIRTKLDSKR